MLTISFLKSGISIKEILSNSLKKSIKIDYKDIKNNLSNRYKMEVKHKYEGFLRYLTDSKQKKKVIWNHGQIDEINNKDILYQASFHGSLIIKNYTATFTVLFQTLKGKEENRVQFIINGIHKKGN